MLVLSRKKNESIIIDDQITITVIEIRGDKVRLGINAPRDVPVHRSEVHALLQQTQLEQSQFEASQLEQPRPSESASPDNSLESQPKSST